MLFWVGVPKSRSNKGSQMFAVAEEKSRTNEARQEWGGSGVCGELKGLQLTIIFASLLSLFLPWLLAGDSRDVENGSRMPSGVSSYMYRARTCHLSMCILKSKWCFIASMHIVQLPTRWKVHKPRFLGSFFRIKLTSLPRMPLGRLKATVVFDKHGHFSDRERQGWR